MKVSDLFEGMYVVKSADGVEKRFKDANSAEAKAWKEKTAKKAKPAKYSPQWWTEKWEKSGFDDYDTLWPWTKISADDAAEIEKIAKDIFGGRMDDLSIISHSEITLESGQDVAVATIRATFEWSEEDDIGIRGEPVSDMQTFKVMRDDKNPKKLVFTGYK
jgi:hypothetical protein